jgi:hypothetical protein
MAWYRIIEKKLYLCSCGNFFQTLSQVENLNVYPNKSDRRLMNKVAWYHRYLKYCDISFHEKESVWQPDMSLAKYDFSYFIWYPKIFLVEDIPLC